MLRAATKLIFCMHGFVDMLNTILILPKAQIDYNDMFLMIFIFICLYIFLYFSIVFRFVAVWGLVLGSFGFC